MVYSPVNMKIFLTNSSNLQIIYEIMILFFILDDLTIHKKGQIPAGNL
jgi:hypothetical protein